MDTPAECKDLTKYCRKIIGLAKNFKIEGEDVSSYPTEPLLFLKVPTTLLKEGKPIRVPEGYGHINYEVELGVIIGREGSNIPEDEALNHIGGYCLTLDITSFDMIIGKLKPKGHPWLLGKSHDTFTPISDFIPKEEIPDPHNVNLWLKVDGALKQSGNTKDLFFNIPHMISYASKIMTLQPGDLFLSGTPAGAGACTPGQVIECGVEGVRDMKFEVA